MKLIDCFPFRLGLCVGEFLEMARMHRNKASSIRNEKLRAGHEAMAKALEHCARSLSDFLPSPEGLRTVIEDWAKREANARAEGLDDLEITYQTARERLREFVHGQNLGIPA